MLLVIITATIESQLQISGMQTLQRQAEFSGEKFGEEVLDGF